jgi:hypothetical protein
MMAEADAVVRLDDEYLQGAVGLTADKKTRTAGRAKTGTGAGVKRARNPDQHIANALRSAYEEAIQEDVPPEFLDLLGRLD